MNNIPEREYIFASIFALANRMQKLGDKLEDYVTIKQWMLLAVLSKSEGQSLTISEAAEIIGSSHQNIKKMALILEKQGFLSLTKHPKDRRAVVVSITDYCNTYFAEREAKEEAFLQSVFQGVDSQMMTELYKGILQLQKNIEQMELQTDEK
ncbi:MarR family transcriptional regulator [Enterococcus sp. BWM-S5]|uniref:MarR family transcriptional regulator n=1 Tax=Enterococcus larvae TaxID=2794352 RepID=A0ABS4CKB3_9ENTE|nr:MarR family transcriptional regulator [Enterococcus larvae]MBP1046910.1 MarR family transcriptional regulator [Enterococcus larvae]